MLSDEAAEQEFETWNSKQTNLKQLNNKLPSDEITYDNIRNCNEERDTVSEQPSNFTMRMRRVLFRYLKTKT